MIVNSNRGEQFYKTSDYFSDDPDTMYCFAKKSELTQNKTEELLPKLVKLSTTKYVYALTILDDTPETDKICHGGVITNLKGIRN